MWGHSESIVRAIELELFVVLFNPVFGTADVSNYSKCRPNFVHSLSPLGSLFFVSKSSQNGPKSGQQYVHGVVGLDATHSSEFRHQLFCRIKMRMCDSRLMLQNENESVDMKIDSFQNEIEMTFAGRDPKMTFTK